VEMEGIVSCPCCIHMGRIAAPRPCCIHTECPIHQSFLLFFFWLVCCLFVDVELGAGTHMATRVLKGGGTDMHPIYLFIAISTSEGCGGV
jgi:hypothetical protein